MNIRRKIGDKLLGRIMDNLPDKDTILANIELQFMEIEVQSDLTGEKISFTIARKDKEKFMNFLNNIEKKAIE